MKLSLKSKYPGIDIFGQNNNTIISVCCNGHIDIIEISINIQHEIYKYPT
jgi:hypothetical protein